MYGRLKHAEESAAPDMSAGSPIPTPSISPTFAAGKKGPVGTSPRTNYSRVNTGEPQAPDAGAATQKSMPPRGAEMLPKVAGERLMGKMAGRPTLQDIVKTAMVESATRVQINHEAQTQARNMGVDVVETKTASSRVNAEQHVEKLASALDYLAISFAKTANQGTENPPGVSQSAVGGHPAQHSGQGVHTVPMHPGQQKALPAEQTATQMENTLHHAPGGSAHMVQKNAFAKRAETEGKPTHLTGSDKAVALLAGGAGGYFGATKGAPQGKAMEGGVRGSLGASLGLGAGAVAGLLAGRKLRSKSTRRMHREAREIFGPHRPASSLSSREALGMGAGAAAGGVGGYKALTHGIDKPHHHHTKESSVADLVRQKLGGVAALVRQKLAEDAINPAHITAGAAVAPDTSASGESGGAPVAGAPQGPTSLIGSNESAMNYKRNAAYSSRKADSAKYWNEPMQSAAHDTVLRDAFAHTSEAGPKLSSVSVKTAAARALLMNIAQSAEAQGAAR